MKGREPARTVLIATVSIVAALACIIGKYAFQSNSTHRAVLQESDPPARSVIMDSRRVLPVYDGTHNVDNHGDPPAIRGQISPRCAVLPRKDCLPPGMSDWDHGDPLPLDARKFMNHINHVWRKPSVEISGVDEAAHAFQREESHQSKPRITAGSRESRETRIEPIAGIPSAIMEAFRQASVRAKQAGMASLTKAGHAEERFRALEAQSKLASKRSGQQTIMEGIGADDVPNKVMAVFLSASIGGSANTEAANTSRAAGTAAHAPSTSRDAALQRVQAKSAVIQGQGLSTRAEGPKHAKNLDEDKLEAAGLSRTDVHAVKREGGHVKVDPKLVKELVGLEGGLESEIAGIKSILGDARGR